MGNGHARTPGGGDGEEVELEMGTKGWVNEGARPVGTRWWTWPKSQVIAASMMNDDDEFELAQGNKCWEVCGKVYVCCFVGR